MEKKRVSNRVIAYEASRNIARFLHKNLDSKEEKKELSAVISGHLIPNRSVLNWLEDRGRRAHTVLWLNVGTLSDTDRLIREVLKVCVECISNYPNEHPCYREYIAAFPFIETEETSSRYEELDKELEKAKFAQEEERGDVQ